MSNLGPLTETFTPPASCSESTGWYKIYQGTTLYHDFRGPYTVNECLPPGYVEGTENYYSPGVCPSGYTSACTRTNNNFVESTVCCPVAAAATFLCKTGIYETEPLQCVYPVSRSATLTSVRAVLLGTTSIIDTSIINPSSGLTHAFGAYGVVIIGGPTSDETTLATSTAGGSTGASTASETTSDSSDTAIPDPSPDGGDGLSKGTIAGIAVGSVLGGLLLGALLVMFLLRRRAQKGREDGGQTDTPFDLQPEVRQTGEGVKYGPVATHVPHAEEPITPTSGGWSPPPQELGSMAPPPQELGNTAPQPHEMYAGDVARGGTGAYDGR